MIKTRRACSMIGSRFIPHVPPSTIMSSGASPQADCTWATTAMPSPSSPMSGLPTPRTTSNSEVSSAIGILFLDRNEAAAAHHGRHRAAPFEQIGANRQVDVEYDEQREVPRRDVMNDAHHL